MSNPSADIYRSLRNKVGKFTCDLCGAFWPVTTMRRMTGGAHVSTLCGDWEPDGDSEDRDLRRAYASRMGALLTMKESQPPKAPNGEVYPGTQDDAPSMITNIDPFPITLIHGAIGYTAVTLTGVGFNQDTDQFTFRTAEIQSQIATFIDETTWIIHIRATALCPLQRHSLIFNDDIWTAAIDVR